MEVCKKKNIASNFNAFDRRITIRKILMSSAKLIPAKSGHLFHSTHTFGTENKNGGIIFHLELLLNFAMFARNTHDATFCLKRAYFVLIRDS